MYINFSTKIQTVIQMNEYITGTDIKEKVNTRSESRLNIYFIM